MNKNDRSANNGLFKFISSSPSAFHAINTIGGMLEDKGFKHLFEYEKWQLSGGGKYYVTKNSSSVIAFEIPDELALPLSYMICASHSDSPTFKLKDNFELTAFDKYIKLDTEKYGGMIMSSWFDRPLSIAGRIAVKTSGGIETRLVCIDRDLLIIPNVAIHMNRAVNDGYKYNAQIDTLPLYAEKSGKGTLLKLIAKSAKVSEDSIISHDIFLYARDKGSFFGADNEFIASPRLDNLQCAYSTLCGFTGSEKSKSVKVYAVFDNEETGSSTKQGAGSSFLHDVLKRINLALGGDDETYLSSLASSFMLSADNAHAKHPNHPEFADAINSPDMNGGVVVKFNASQKYTTDSLSASVVYTLCDKAGVPYQKYSNRSDIAGGSTLGSISDTKVSLCTADIGLAQLAMHSAYETAGSRDTLYMEKLALEFYKTELTPCENGFKLS